MHLAISIIINVPVHVYMYEQLYLHDEPELMGLFFIAPVTFTCTYKYSGRVVKMHERMHRCLQVRMHVCTYVCIFVCTYGWMVAGMYVRKYVLM